ncbi:MAG: hypothetical protein HC847_28110 [Hydrococcus sp. RU_2_2]|nr:hypothetical protein [Hydrococcus sp. RU_2_2]
MQQQSVSKAFKYGLLGLSAIVLLALISFFPPVQWLCKEQLEFLVTIRDRLMVINPERSPFYLRLHQWLFLAWCVFFLWVV